MKTATIAARYERRSKIAETGLGETWIAEDRATHKKVILKCISPDRRNMNIENILLYQKGAQVVQKNPHPTVASLYDFGERDGTFCIASEYVQGKSLSFLLAEKGILDVDLFLKLAIPIAQTIEFFHAHHLVHGSIKPENIMVLENADGISVKILDFGVTLLCNLQSAFQARLSDVFAYLSPEQSGMLRRPVDTHSDCYSLGVLFYRMLAGKLPYDQHDIYSLVHMHIASHPPALQSANPRVPPIIARVVEILLQKEISQRYSSAQTLARDLIRIKSGLEGKPEDISFVPNSAGLTGSLKDYFGMIGRNREQSGVMSIYQEAVEGRGSIILIQGETGTGKSRFIEAINEKIVQSNGICVGFEFKEIETPLPYEGFTECLSRFFQLMDMFSRETRNNVEASIQKAVENRGELLLPLVPELSGIITRAVQLSPISGEKEKIRFEDAFIRLLKGLAANFPAVVFFIENIQWADYDTQALLAKLASTEQPGNLLFIVTGRNADPQGQSRYARYVQEMAETKNFSKLGLGNLSQEEVRQMVRSMLGGASDELDRLAGLVYTRTAGNALFVREFIHMLFREEKIRFQEEWKIDFDGIEVLPIADNIVSLLLNGVNQLSDSEQQILSLAAVCGKEFKFSHLTECWPDRNTDLVFAAIENAKAKKILFSGSTTICFSHDLIHEIFYHKIDPERRRQMHEQIARYFETQQSGGNGSAYTILHHFRRSANNAKKTEYLVKAGRFAQKRTSHQDAAGFFKEVIDDLEHDPGAIHANISELRELYAESLRHIGNYPESIIQYGKAIAATGDVKHGTELYKKLSYAYSACGQFPEAIATLTQALALLGQKVPSTAPMLGFKFTKELFLQFVHSRFSRMIRKTRAEHENPLYQKQIIFQMIGWVCIWAIKQDLLVYSHFKALNLADRTGISEEGAELLLTHCAVLISLDAPPPMVAILFKRIRKILSRVDVALNVLGDPMIPRALYLAVDAAVDVAVMRDNSTFHKAQQALSLLREQHTVTYLMEVSNCAAQVFELYGKFQELFHLADELRLQGTIYGNQLFTSTADLYEGIACYFTGKNDLAIRLCESACQSFMKVCDNVNALYARLFLVKAHGRRGDFVKAKAYFDESIAVMKQEHQTHPVVISRIYPFFLEELLDKYIAFSRDETTKAERLLLAGFCFKKSRKAAAAYPVQIPMFTRLRALYQWIVLHKPDLAQKTFERGLAALEDCPQVFHCGMLHFRYGEFLIKRNPLAALEHLEKAFIALDECGARFETRLVEKRIKDIRDAQETAENKSPESLMVGEKVAESSFTTHRKLDTVIDISKKISFIHNIDELLNEVLTHAIQLVGAEQGELFLYENGKPVSRYRVALAGAETVPASRGVVAKVDYSGKPLVICDARQDPAFRNDPVVMEYGLRSILCAPLTSHTKKIGVLYLSNHHVGGLFTEHELDLLNAMAGQAAIAIENSLLFRETKLLQTHLTNIIDSFPGALVALDITGGITYMNSAAKQMFPELEHASTGKILWHTVPFLAKYHRAFEQVVREKRHIEFHRETFNRQFWWITIFPLMDEEITGAVIKINDITEQEKMQQHLIQAQKMETVETLVGGLAHDFNNILGGILTTTSFLTQSILPSREFFTRDDFQSEFSMITTLVNRAIKLVQQLLTISMRKDVSITPVDLNIVVTQVAKICRQSFDKSIRFDIADAPSPAIILADIAQLEQVLLNLCINASHAMTIMRQPEEKWGGTLKVNLRKMELDRPVGNGVSNALAGEYWRLTVEDTGVGMTEEVMKKIFEPFFTTKETGKGTGLGLAMVYSIIRKLNGHINVYSEPGQGAIFHVYFPAQEAPAAAIVQETPSPSTHRGTGTILVIEDEEVIRKTMEKILQASGYSVILASDGAQGIERFAENRAAVSLVLLDMMMPRESGKQVFMEIKAMAPGARVVLMSGFRKDARVEEVMSLGIDGFLQKPFNQEELFEVIQKVLLKEP